MDKAIAYLFESMPKEKLLKLFFRNAELAFSIEDAQKHTRLSKKQITREVTKLSKLGIIGKKVRIDIDLKAKGKKKARKVDVFFANPEFELFHELRGLFLKPPTTNQRLAESVKRLGKVKLAIVSGFFINNPLSRVDLLIVGDQLDRKRLANFLSKLESETGKTMSYAVMSSDEFRYRMNMFDRFLRDILEFPHQKLINKVNA